MPEGVANMCCPISCSWVPWRHKVESQWSGCTRHGKFRVLWKDQKLTLTQCCACLLGKKTHCIQSGLFPLTRAVQSYAHQFIRRAWSSVPNAPHRSWWRVRFCSSHPLAHHSPPHFFFCSSPSGFCTPGSGRGKRSSCGEWANEDGTPSMHTCAHLVCCLRNISGGLMDGPALVTCVLPQQLRHGTPLLTYLPIKIRQAWMSPQTLEPLQENQPLARVLFHCKTLEQLKLTNIQPSVGNFKSLQGRLIAHKSPMGHIHLDLHKSPTQFQGKRWAAYTSLAFSILSKWQLWLLICLHKPLPGPPVQHFPPSCVLLPSLLPEMS